ncbi:unnamed protein product [Rodentolepis nana]|uniref:BCL domain-containing protein n=1 Tax=Rodentolepis nana TaxID=102285 RepID=A0A0R3T181_RODNA|nr:unnamed protein product [Rodentolepis nana]
MNSGSFAQSVEVDVVPNTPERSCSNDVDGLTVDSAIDLKKIKQFDKQLHISDRIEETNEEEVKNTFPNIFTGLIASQSPVELPELSTDLNSDEQKVVEQLAQIGEKINALFGSEIESMLGQFHSTISPFGILSKIFSGLFKDKEYSWGKIFAFIHFGVKLFLKSNGNIIPSMLKDLCVEIVEVIGIQLAQGAFKWIANRGGWIRVGSGRLEYAEMWGWMKLGSREEEIVS